MLENVEDFINNARELSICDPRDVSLLAAP